eukprot:846397-Pyramimonas_sp.AAC.1
MKYKVVQHYTTVNIKYKHIYTPPWGVIHKLTKASRVDRNRPVGSISVSICAAIGATEITRGWGGHILIRDVLVGDRADIFSFETFAVQAERRPGQRRRSPAGELRGDPAGELCRLRGSAVRGGGGGRSGGECPSAKPVYM